MTIIFVDSDGQTCPRVICDHCLQVIEDAGRGLVKWNYETGGDILVVHKGDCDRKSLGGTHPDRWPWQPLDAFWIYVGKNLKIDLKKSVRVAEMLSNL